MSDEYYTMDTDKVAQVVWEAKRQAKRIYRDTLTEDRIRDFMFADWSEGSAHQDWLNTASITDIAEWVVDGICR